MYHLVVFFFFWYIFHSLILGLCSQKWKTVESTGFAKAYYLGSAENESSKWNHNLSWDWYSFLEENSQRKLLWFLIYMQNTSNLLFTGKIPVFCHQNNIHSIAIWLCSFPTTMDALKPHRLTQHLYLNQLYTTPKFSLKQCYKCWIPRDKLQK